MGDNLSKLDWLQVSSTLPTADAARALADTLVREGLAACVQLQGPILSTFLWKGETESSEEWLCTMKTRGSLVAALQQRITELHPYEVPEIIATPILAISTSYLAWLEECLPPTSG